MSEPRESTNQTRVPTAKKDWLRNLDKCLVLINGIEAFYIEEIEDINSIYKFVHSQYLYTEVNLKLKAIHYRIVNNKVQTRTVVSTTTLTISNSCDLIKISETNIAHLLTDRRDLVRQAARDWWFSQQVS